VACTRGPHPAVQHRTPAGPRVGSQPGEEHRSRHPGYQAQRRGPQQHCPGDTVQRAHRRQQHSAEHWYQMWGSGLVPLLWRHLHLCPVGVTGHLLSTPEGAVRYKEPLPGLAHCAQCGAVATAVLPLPPPASCAVPASSTVRWGNTTCPPPSNETTDLTPTQKLHLGPKAQSCLHRT
jgi:hypothetical protein